MAPPLQTSSHHPSNPQKDRLGLTITSIRRIPNAKHLKMLPKKQSNSVRRKRYKIKHKNKRISSGHNPHRQKTTHQIVNGKRYRRYRHHQQNQQK